jgi:transposase
MENDSYNTDTAEKRYTIQQVLLTYNSWMAMKRRCSGKSKNKNDMQYTSVKVDPEWSLSFKKFIADLGPRESVDITLDRFPDRNGDYVPGNVRWANKTEQATNRDATVFITYNGESLSIAEWSRRTGLNRSVISSRLEKGWPVEKIFTEPVTKGFVDGRQKGNKLTHNQVQEILRKAECGEANMSELGREYGVAATSILSITKRFGIKFKKRYQKQQ